jgi:hypothetical protein
MPLKTLHIGTILGFSVKKPLAFGPGGVVFSGCLFFFIFLLLLNGLRGRLVFYVIINIKKSSCNVHLLVCKYWLLSLNGVCDVAWWLSNNLIFLGIPSICGWCVFFLWMFGFVLIIFFFSSWFLFSCLTL